MNKTKNSKIVLVLSVFLIFLIIGSASAAEDTDEIGNETILTSTQMGVDTVTNAVDEEVSAADTDIGSDTGNQVLGASDNSVLSDGENTFVDLKGEVEASSTVTLSGSYYLYDDGQGSAINVTGKIIDGNGATIDCNNVSNVYPFYCSGNVTLKNINFINLKQSTQLTNFQGGPVRFADNSNNITFDSCTFSKITTTVGNTAGAIGINGGKNVIIKNCKFFDNAYWNSLVILYPSLSENVTVENCEFYRNTASSANGDLYFSSVNNLIIRNCNFTNEKPMNRIVYTGPGSQKLIEDCVFDNNNIGASGIEIAGSNATIKNCNFTNNNVVQGVLLSSATYTTITECNFINTTSKGTAKTHPSSILVSGGYSTLNNCNITNSKSTTNYDYNGAVYWSGSDGEIYNVHFSDCHSNSGNGDGGAITIIGKDNNLHDCTFKNCTAGDNSGAICLADRFNNITDCTFNDCSALYGGAIWTDQSFNNIENCNFTNCNASRRGSAISITGSCNNINKCNFNDCVNTYDGSTANKNYGGTVSFAGQGNVVSESNFTNCSSLFNGSAIYYYGTTMGTVDSCTFTNNNAISKIYSNGNNLNILNSKFTDNGDEALNIQSGTSYYLKDNTGLTISNMNIGEGAVLLDARDFYISLSGTGEGKTSSDPTNLTYAYNHIASGYTIYFTEDINTVSGLYSGDKINLYKKDIIIDGQGHTINANSASFEFNIAGDNVTIKNFNFKNFITANYAAPVHFGGDSINSTVYNCNFTNCSKFATTDTTQWGGAIFVGWSSAITIVSPTIDKCNFESCTAGAGACIYSMAHGASNIIRYMTISNCYATGGKITGAARGSFIELNAQYSTLVNVTCINMSASTGQGAIGMFSLAPNTDIINCTFINCKSLNNFGGGAISSENAANKYLNIIGCKFIDCSAPSSGAIYVKNQYSEIKDCIFINNTATTTQAGAVRFDAANSVITNCIFINNTASTNAGAVLFAGSTSNIMNSRFINNTAGNGGAVYYSGSSCVLKDSILLNNSASGAGGAIYFSGSYCILSDSIMEFNNAIGAGGAVQFTGTGCNITNCNFTNNTGGTHGGAVHFAGKNSEMWYCIYTNNTCLEDGGALCSQAEGSTVAYCNFTGRNNTAKTGNDFYAHPGCSISFIGLKFAALWLTNETYYDSAAETYDTDVAHGYGTGWERPACWDNDNIWLSFLETSNGKATIYLVGDITSLPEKILNIPNLEIIGYDPSNNPNGATIDMTGWNHRVFTVNENNIQIRNLKFENADIKTAIDGGVIKVDGDNCLVDNCTFDNIFNALSYSGHFA